MSILSILTNLIDTSIKKKHLIKTENVTFSQSLTTVPSQLLKSWILF